MPIPGPGGLVNDHSCLGSSWLDCCNVLYMELLLKTIQELQLDQNTSACIGPSQFAHVTPLLRKLHLLPVLFLVQFKVLVITFKILHGTRPGYLQDHLSLRLSACSTRLDKVCTLQVPFLKCCQVIGPRKCAFSAAALTLWNTFHMRSTHPLSLQ